MREHRSHLGEAEQHKADLCEGELYLAEYSPLEARPIFEYLTAVVTPNSEPDLAIRALRGLGECALNECTIDTASLSDTVAHWEKGIQLSKEFEQEIGGKLAGSLLENLGLTYQLLGMHEFAREYYMQALEIYRSNNLGGECAEVLDKIGTLYREQNKCKEALDCLEQSLQIKESVGDRRGVGLTYSLMALANGDLWKIEEAERYSHKALALLEEVNDPWAVSLIYGRMAWLKFITRNLAPENLGEAERYARKAVAIQEERGFGRGLSKEYHTLFHVVELKEGLEAAEPYIRKACDCARRSSDIFFLFDALTHIARIEYGRGDYCKLPQYLAEMESYERRGARISVFKGRLMTLLGHVALRNGDLENALRYYDQGWHIIVRKRTASTVPPLEQEHEDFKKQLLQIPCPQANMALVAEKVDRIVQEWVDEERKRRENRVESM